MDIAPDQSTPSGTQQLQCRELSTFINNEQQVVNKGHSLSVVDSTSTVLASSLSPQNKDTATIDHSEASSLCARTVSTEPAVKTYLNKNTHFDTFCRTERTSTLLARKREGRYSPYRYTLRKNMRPKLLFSQFPHPFKQKSATEIDEKSSSLIHRELSYSPYRDTCREKMRPKLLASQFTHPSKRESATEIDEKLSSLIHTAPPVDISNESLRWTDEIEKEQKEEEQNYDPLAFLHAGYFEARIITVSENKAAIEKINSHSEIKLSDQDISLIKNSTGKPVGMGVHSIVYALSDTDKYQQQVLKLSKENQQSKMQIINEASYLCQFSHPNVIKLTGCCLKPSYTCLILEKKHKSLMKYIDRQQAKPFSTCKKMLCDMVKGINYLHSKEIIHRDAHAGNFLIDNNDTVLITDLGMAAHLSTTKCLYENPPAFNSAPELTYKENAVQDIATDVFSLGFSMQSVLSWKVQHLAWFAPELKNHNSIIKHKVLTDEAAVFCDHIAICKEQNPKVKKTKWLIHEVMPDKMLLNHEYNKNEPEAALNVLSLVKRAMAYNPKERPDTQTMLTTLS